MTLSITFYDGIKYKRTDFMARDSDFFGNGVVNLSHFPYTLPTPNNMTVQIGAGVAWVDGYRIANDANVIPLTVSAADPTYSRIDIVQIGHDDINSQAVLTIKKGVASSSPVEPSADPNNFKLYAISVAANATSISSGNITDRRSLVPINVNASQIAIGGTSPQSILSSLETVDGPGSGLDADTVDGKHYSDIQNFVYGFGLGSTAMDISNTNLNSLASNGFYMGSNLTNSPNTGYSYYVIHIQQSTFYGQQIAIQYGSNSMQLRYNNGGTWTSWVTLAIAANVVPYSGASQDLNLGGYAVKANLIASTDGNADGIYFQWNEEANNGFYALKSRNVSDGSSKLYLINANPNGNMSFPNQSACYYSNGSNQSIPQSVQTKLTCLTVKNYDRQNEFNTTNCRFTAIDSGIYDVEFYLDWGTTFPASDIWTRLYKNGSYYAIFNYENSRRALNGSVTLSLNAGDYLEFYVDHYASSAYTISAAHISIAKIS